MVIAVKAPRNASLDILRGLTFCMILVWHYGVNRTPALAEAPALLWYPLRLAWTGVDLFFVTSGFLIAGNLLDARGGDRPLRAFYIRRVCRILPLYLLTIALFALLGSGNWWAENGSFFWLFDGGAKIGVWPYLGFLQNFFMVKLNSFGPNWIGVTWTLSIEEQFYVLIPWLVLFAPRWMISIVAIAGILLAPLLRLIAVDVFHTTPLTTFVLTPFRADTLSTGVLLAWISRNHEAQEFLVKRRRAVLAMFFISSVAVAVVVVEGWQVLQPRTTIFGFSIFAIFYGFLVLLVSRSNVVSRIPGSSILHWVGVRCYFAYLFHQPIIGLLHGALLHTMVQNTTPQGVLVTLLAVAVTMLLADLSWRFIERPMIRFGYRRSGQIAKVPA